MEKVTPNPPHSPLHDLYCERNEQALCGCDKRNIASRLADYDRLKASHAELLEAVKSLHSENDDECGGLCQRAILIAAAENEINS